MLKLFLESKILWSLIRYIRLIGPADKTNHEYRSYLRLSYDSVDGWYYRDNGICDHCTYNETICMMKDFIKYDGLRWVSFK